MIIFREWATELEEVEKPTCLKANKEGTHLQWRLLCGAKVGLTTLDYVPEHQ